MPLHNKEGRERGEQPHGTSWHLAGSLQDMLELINTELCYCTSCGASTLVVVGSNTLWKVIFLQPVTRSVVWQQNPTWTLLFLVPPPMDVFFSQISLKEIDFFEYNININFKELAVAANPPRLYQLNSEDFSAAVHSTSPVACQCRRQHQTGAAFFFWTPCTFPPPSNVLKQKYRGKESDQVFCVLLWQRVKENRQKISD